MKKKFILPVCSLVFFFGCQDNNDTYLPSERAMPNELENISSRLDSVYSKGISFTEEQQMLFNIGKIGKTEIFTFNSRKSLKNVSDHLNSEIFENKFNNIFSNTDFIKTVSASNRVTGALGVESITNLLDTASIYSDRQKNLLINLTNDILNSDDFESESLEIISAFNKNVYNSADLLKSEKIALLNYSAMYKSFFKFVEDGGVDDVYNSMSASLSSSGVDRSNARVMGCKLNSRDILINATYGAIKGAVLGALAGAAGGTATIPGVGTVAGVVGGGVFGLATGFTYGVIDGIATGLIATCFRYETNSQAQCKNLFSEIEKGNITLTPNLMSANPGCFQLNIDSNTEYLILN